VNDAHDPGLNWDWCACDFGGADRRLVPIGYNVSARTKWCQ